MNILTICRRGNHRSVLTAMLLRDQRGYRDVIPAGIESLSDETLSMLFNWAEKILVVAEGVANRIPVEHQNKVIIMELGVDLWGLPFHPPFAEKANQYLDEHGFIKI
jgi:hypothetical protein